MGTGADSRDRGNQSPPILAFPHQGGRDLVYSVLDRRRCKIQFIGVNGGIVVCLAIYRILLTRLCGHFLSFRAQRGM